MTNNIIQEPQQVILPEELLLHWQGHRQLTRRVIEAFPEHELFHYSIGGMRPFSEMAIELISLAAAGIQGMVTGSWRATGELDHHAGQSLPGTKAEILRQWDLVTQEINHSWLQIPLERFQELDMAFGQYEGPIIRIMLYWVDNENHHRGQGYVYLRSLGIEPPPFWDRY
ncbi:damage-inducible protein DinB [Chitinophaga agrisoli]|uniref:Damage-inducible protein DinB n=1 Tax=Chitinophaga agrisoli TaxID=2607653 RepID=A0A5B2VR69_9BACT|nr:DinB family protein [Chitinophaga agrisoli]KAA2240886.1 damage-inducible protein DinB [Chitinophaga agrisoli]